MMVEFKKYMVKALNFELLMALSLTLYFVLYSKESIIFLLALVMKVQYLLCR